MNVWNDEEWRADRLGKDLSIIWGGPYGGILNDGFLVGRRQSGSEWKFIK